MTSMMLFAALAQAAAQPSCAAEINADPARAAIIATDRHARGGGPLALQCAGLAYAAQDRWAEAAAAFEAGAREAGKDAIAPYLWIQAANARLAGGQPLQAISALDAAIGSGALTGQTLGEARLDRARAAVATGDTKSARADLDEALKLVPQDPLAWLLSASLARRMGDLERAGSDIGEASRLSPDDASVALEAGRIALAAGSPEAARIAFDAAVKVQPGSEAAKAAQAELDRLGPPAHR